MIVLASKVAWLMFVYFNRVSTVIIIHSYNFFSLSRALFRFILRCIQYILICILYLISLFSYFIRSSLFIILFFVHYCKIYNSLEIPKCCMCFFLFFKKYRNLDIFNRCWIFMDLLICSFFNYFFLYIGFRLWRHLDINDS